MVASLDPNQWQRVKELLAPALELPAEQLTHYLNESCADPELRQQVRTLFDAFHLDSDFLEGHLEHEAAGETLGEGSQIGAYCLREKVGEGGMGEVFVALQERPIQRTVALKLIRPGLTNSQALLRFQGERQALALMSHPNIARIYDAGEGPGGRPYVVMEYLVGRPITEYCDAKCASLEARLQRFQEVLEGVRHAHRKGVIHRDLKPSNILVVDEDRPVPKIIDFGIAKVLETEATAVSSRTPELATELGQWLGTPDYMSPEQAGGARGSVDIRSDIYALGALLYELLCGRRPLNLPEVHQAGLAELLEAIRHQPPSPPSERLRGDPQADAIARRRGLTAEALSRRLHGDLSRILMKALAKDPAERYESCAELAEDLRRYQAGEPLLAASPTALEQLARWVRRHRLAASVAALFLVSLLAGIIGTTSGLIRARNAEATAHSLATQAQDESRRARDAAASAQQVTDFLVSVLKASDPTQLVKPNITLREVLDTSARRIHTELSEQPVAQAQMMVAMSYSYESLGDFQQARALGEDALAALRAHPREHPAHLVDALVATSEAYLGLGQLDVSLSHLHEALRIEEDAHGPDHVRSARLFNNLGMVYRLTGELDRAREALEKALSLREGVLDENDLNIALTLDNLGLVLSDLGENQLASDYLERSVRLHERALGPDHPELSYSLNNLAMVRARERDFEAARQLFERALTIDRTVFGADHPHIATGLYNLGYLAAERGDCPNASRRFQAALDIFEAALPADHWKTRSTSEALEKQRALCGSS
ncbi:MAG: serine/threonine-protein kinase [Acidobacteriota bacterium]